MSSTANAATAVSASSAGDVAPQHPNLLALRRAVDMFDETTQEHRVTVLLQQGLHRHVRFARPGTRMYSCEITTWPGHLAVTGDMGTFLFARDEDMFAWFTGGLSPDYRGQKCVAHDGITRYSRDVLAFHLRGQLRDWVQDLREEYEEYDAAPAPRRRPVATVHSSLLNGADTPPTDAQTDPESPDPDPQSPDPAHDAVLESAIAQLRSEVEDLISWHGDSAAEAYREMRDFSCTLTLPGGDTRRFTLEDSWEWDLTEWTVQYLWCLHAVRKVISELPTATPTTPITTSAQQSSTTPLFQEPAVA